MHLSFDRVLLHSNFACIIIIIKNYILIFKVGLFFFNCGFWAQERDLHVVCFL